MSSAARSSRVGPSQLAGYVNRIKQSATRPVGPRCLGIGSAETYFITLGLDGYARAKVVLTSIAEKAGERLLGTALTPRDR
jgi:hypothetical protein